MRTPPNAVTVFGTTGAIGASRAAASTALAGLNGKRLAIGTAHAVARLKVKRLRVESSPMKIICRPYPALCKYWANAAFSWRSLGTPRFKVAYSGGNRRIWARLGLKLAVNRARHQSQSFSLGFLHSLMVLMILDSDLALLLVEYLSRDRTISSYFASVVAGSFGTMCTIL